MGFFSRNREATDASASNPTAFDTVRRSARSERKRSGAESRFDAGEPLDPADATRRRARHRLIGAVALALAAIVFVPMLFNATPVAPADDIALQIPDRDTPFEGRRGVPDPGRSPLKPSSDLPIVAPPTVTTPAAAPEAPVVGKAADAPPTINLPMVPRPAEVAAKAEKPVERAVDKPVEKTPEPVPEKPKQAASEPAKPSDDPRALAALEGRAAAEPKVAAEPAAGKSFAVQVAAYASADTARGERDRLVANGLKAYTESVSTSQGLRVRVRLGPFTSRDAADRARAKLKTMKLDGSVVPL